MHAVKVDPLAPAHASKPLQKVSHFFCEPSNGSGKRLVADFSAFAAVVVTLSYDAAALVIISKRSTEAVNSLATLTELGA
jgi:hypothetical protein